MKATAAHLLVALYRMRVFGLENLPEQGGYILAGNHVSYLDPILLWCVTPHRTHFVARAELFDTPVVGWVSSHVYAFPISRDSADRVAIQRATDLLTHGEPVGMFPEGTRKRAGQDSTDTTLGEAHAGVAFIAMRAGVPVVPVGISGTEKALPVGAKIPRFPRVTVRFGFPVSPQEFAEGGRKERTAAMTTEIMRRIALERDAASEE
jgi:1-acyl-sn-glycerol-3-phosphate acyltransferase